MRRPDPLKSYAVLVGVGSYAEYLPVPGARSNVEALRAVLTGPRGCVAPQNCTVVHDPATPEEVLKPLRAYGAVATDLFFFYYVGHGFDTGSEELLLAVGKTNKDEFLQKSTALSWDAVRYVIRKGVAAPRTVVVLDSCYSGLATNHLGAGAPHLDIEGTYLLPSCPATKRIEGGVPHTFFTGALLDVLRNGIPDEVEYLTPKLVHAELVRRLSRQRWDLPLPLKSGTVEDLPLLPNPAYKSADMLTARERFERWWRKQAVRRQMRAQNRPKDPKDTENQAEPPRIRTRTTPAHSVSSLAVQTAPQKTPSGTADAAKVSNTAKGGMGGGALVVALVIFGIAIFNSAERHNVGGLPFQGEAPVNDNGTLRYELRAGSGNVNSTFELPVGFKYRSIRSSSVHVALAQGCRNVEFTLAVQVDARELYHAGFKNSATGAARVNSMTLPSLDKVNLDVAGTTKELRVIARATLEPGCSLNITLGNFEVVDSDTEWILDVV